MFILLASCLPHWNESFRWVEFLSVLFDAVFLVQLNKK